VSFWQFLNQWWNLPYLVMLGLVAVYFGMQALGLVAHAGDADADADVDHDLGHELEHELEHELDHDADHDLDHDADHDSDHDGESHGLAAALGVGRVPFMVLWLTLFIFTGFTGLFVNRLVQVRSGAYPPWFFLVSLLLSLGAGVVSVRFAARAVSRLVDTGGRGAAARRELAGAVGVVASPLLDEKFGEIRVHDPRGNELIVHGHLQASEAALRQGDKVVLVELENDSGLFQVAALKE
jgi:hypothetical protein